MIPSGSSIHGSVLLIPGRTERDATSWSKGKLREFLVGIVVENEAGRCQIGELKQVEGEASCSSRKGKLIFFYEWNIKLGWKGNGPPGTVRAGGILRADSVDSLFIHSAGIFRTAMDLHILAPELVFIVPDTPIPYVEFVV